MDVKVDDSIFNSTFTQEVTHGLSGDIHHPKQSQYTLQYITDRLRWCLEGANLIELLGTNATDGITGGFHHWFNIPQLLLHTAVFGDNVLVFDF